MAQNCVHLMQNRAFSFFQSCALDMAFNSFIFTPVFFSQGVHEGNSHRWYW